MSNAQSAVAAFEIHEQTEEDRRHRQSGGFDTNQVKTDVLIAEADAKLCGTYQRLFAASGLRIETAVNGLDCWTKLRSSPPDALLVDVDLLWGGSDGVLARLREDTCSASQPEVFVTGDESPEVLSRRSGVAVGRCFQKPLQIGYILDSICDVFSSDPEITYVGWV
jgi:CheY-like chemotaxis protein